MRFVLISDVHSNLEALNSVLTATEDIPYDTILSMGDIVGYNANPNECIEILRDKKVISVTGNHDLRAVGKMDARNFNPIAREAIMWTKNCLSEESIEYLSLLPSTVPVMERLKMCHGWINSADSYLTDSFDAKANFRLAGDEFTFITFGHTHLPAVFINSDGEVTLSKKERVEFEEGKSYAINPGSVGQPRDGNKDASFAIMELDSEGKGFVEFHRVSYNIDKTAEKITKAGLPSPLAERLYAGR